MDENSDGTPYNYTLGNCILGQALDADIMTRRVSDVGSLIKSNRMWRPDDNVES